MLRIAGTLAIATSLLVAGQAPLARAMDLVDVRLDNGGKIVIDKDSLERDNKGYAYFTVYVDIFDYDFAANCRTAASFEKDLHSHEWKPIDEFDPAVVRYVCK
jgi:hypothetical protein